MAGKLPSRIQRRVEKHVKSGQFETPEAVLDRAMDLLEERQAEVRALDRRVKAAVRRGLADVAAGRTTPLEQLSVERIRRGALSRPAAPRRRQSA